MILIDFVHHFPEADKLCGRLYQKLNSILGHKVVMDHMPLLMVCLEVCTDTFGHTYKQEK